jgi:hypothetical protein
MPSSSGNDVIDTFRMQVPAEPLELGTEDRDICVVNLSRGISAASFRSPHHRMSILDLVKRVAPLGVPSEQ